VHTPSSTFAYKNPANEKSQRFTASGGVKYFYWVIFGTVHGKYGFVVSMDQEYRALAISASRTIELGLTTAGDP